MRDPKTLRPDEVVLDLVLDFADKIGKPNSALVVVERYDGKDSGHALMISARNHLGALVTLSVPMHLDGASSIDPPRFVLRRIAPTTWKLAPSINHPLLHAFITVVGVLEPAPWEPKEEAIPKTLPDGAVKCFFCTCEAKWEQCFMPTQSRVKVCDACKERNKTEARRWGGEGGLSFLPIERGG